MEQNGQPRYRLLLDSRAVADDPRLLEWCAGPLAVALAEAHAGGLNVSLMIARLDDDPDVEGPRS